MSQKEFSEETGIQQSTISEWKKNKTNPSSEKILTICKVLDVSPEWLLSGVDPVASRGKNHKYYVVDAETDTGLMISRFNNLEKAERDRLMGYAEALITMNSSSGKSGKKRR